MVELTLESITIIRKEAVKLEAEMRRLGLTEDEDCEQGGGGSAANTDPECDCEDCAPSRTAQGEDVDDSMGAEGMHQQAMPTFSPPWAVGRGTNDPRGVSRA